MQNILVKIEEGIMREMERGGERERDFSEIMLSDDGILIDLFNIQ